jgi:hypothetical protein
VIISQVQRRKRLGIGCNLAVAGVLLSGCGDLILERQSVQSNPTLQQNLVAAQTDAIPLQLASAAGTIPEAVEPSASGRGEQAVVFWPKPVHAHPDVPFRFTMVAYDRENDPIRYALEGAPRGMAIDAEGTITWQPSAGGAVDGSTYAFTVMVDDGRDRPVRVPVNLVVETANFFFVAADGRDNGDGSVNAPWQDLYLAQQRLAAHGHGTLYIRGGLYPVSWNWERKGIYSPFRKAQGTAGQPIVVRGYPGETAVIDAAGRGHGLYFYSTRYILAADLEIRNAAASERGGFVASGDNIIAQNITVRDSNWPKSSNCTGFLFKGGDGNVCHRCRAFDNYDRDSSHWNSSNYLVYADGKAGTTYILDSYSRGSRVGYKIKHAGTGKLVLHGSLEAGSGTGFGGYDNDSLLAFNTFLANGTGIHLGITDPNDYTQMGMTIVSNTVVDAAKTLLLQGTYGAHGDNTIKHNVFATSKALGRNEQDPHLVFARPYDDGVPLALNSDYNCWYAPKGNAGFRFSRSSKGGYADWQAWGSDGHSTWADPQFVSASDYALGVRSACRQGALTPGAWD